MSNRNVDIFSILNKINIKQNKFYETLTKEEYNSIHPYVLMKWMSGTYDENQILKLNHFVNPYIFSLSRNKNVLYDLLISVAPGNNKRYKWVKKNKQQNKSESINVVKEFFGYSTRKAKESMPIFDRETILDMANQLGYDDNSIKKINKEMK